MKTTLTAVAKNKSTIEIHVKKDFCKIQLTKFRLYVNHHVVEQYTPITTSESQSSMIYVIKDSDFDFQPGYYYEIATEQNYFIPIDISFIALTEDFEKKYRFNGKLGAIYNEKATTFRVFSPFSNEITIHILKKNSSTWQTYSMKHNFDNGVFEVTLNGDYDGAAYLYERLMFGNSTLVPDPYSFSLASNGRWSYVINTEKIKAIDSNRNNLPPFYGAYRSIVYEINVRDMTSLTDVENKGTFKALSTKGLKSREGHPIGIDYLATLGVTHIQIMPVLDFQTVDEDDPKSMYNWGYDPNSYFSPEGSYATLPNDPYSRIIELKELVSNLHKEGLRVIFDVVYNHVYSTLFNPLNILCPKYFYRHDENGHISNGSGCGNDLESRNFMTRKLIIDSLLYQLDFYDVDGFRFDLMGILDVETMKQAYKQCTKKKEDLLFYGEGWDLWTNLPREQKASISNANQLPFIGFFNDRFRDVVKGKTGESEIGVRGYLLGDTNYRDGFKHVMLGSSVPLAFAPMFSSPYQSVNYVECHDNNTLYDKIKIACYDDSEEEIKKRVKLNLFATLLAKGIPFFHAGEEFCGTKEGHHNTYNAGDRLNGFDYSLLDKNYDVYEFFVDAIKHKKAFIDLAGNEYKDMMKEGKITFEDLECGALKINYDLELDRIFVIFNPSKSTFMYEFDNYARLVFNDTGVVSKSDVFVKMAIINALSINVYQQQKNEKASKRKAVKL